jgi:hypothetical protein
VAIVVAYLGFSPAYIILLAGAIGIIFSLIRKDK